LIKHCSLTGTDYFINGSFFSNGSSSDGTWWAPKFRIDHGVVLSHILTSYSVPDSTRIKSGLKLGISHFLRFGILFPAYQPGLLEEIAAATVLISLELMNFSATGVERRRDGGLGKISERI
jgi:hypothetical protein